jgi:rubredoxin
MTDEKPKRYMCLICGFIYDEALGLPDEGIPAGTRWDDIPLSWHCPDCGAAKEDFELVEF